MENEISFKINAELELLKKYYPEEILEMVSKKEIYLNNKKFEKIFLFKIFLEKENIVNSLKVNAEDLIFLIKCILQIRIFSDDYKHYFIKTFDYLIEGLRKKLDIREQIPSKDLIDFAELIRLFKTTLMIYSDSEFINKNKILFDNIDFVLEFIVFFLKRNDNLNERERLLHYLIDEKNQSLCNSSQWEENKKEVEIKRTSEKKDKYIEVKENTFFITKSDFENKNIHRSSNLDMGLNEERIEKEEVKQKAPENQKIKIEHLGNNNIILINSNITGKNINIGDNNSNLNNNSSNISSSLTFNDKKYTDFIQNKNHKKKVDKKINEFIDFFYNKEIEIYKKHKEMKEIDKLVNFIKEKLKKYYEVFLIGSVNLEIATNLKEGKFTPDFLLKSINLSIDKKTLIKEMNENEKNAQFTFKFLSKLENNAGIEYNYQVKTKKDEFEIKFFDHFNQYSDSNKSLSEVFKVDNFKKLHIFMQNTLSNLKFSFSRFHISSLIYGFLLYKFPNSEKVQIIKTKSEVSKELNKKQDILIEEKIYSYNFKKSMNTFQNFSLLLFDFFDFFNNIIRFFNKSADLDNFTTTAKILIQKDYIYNLNFLEAKFKDGLHKEKDKQINELLITIMENYDKLSSCESVFDLTNLKSK